MHRIFIFSAVLFLSIYTQAQPSKTSETSNEVKTSEANTSAAKKSDAARKVKDIPKNIGKIILPPEKANPITIPLINVPVVIDGKIDEAMWENAAAFKDFYQTSPGDNVAPS